MSEGKHKPREDDKIKVVRQGKDYCILEVSRGIGPRYVEDVWLPKQQDVLVETDSGADGDDCINCNTNNASERKPQQLMLVTPHYKAYARALVLVMPRKSPTISTLEYTIRIDALCWGCIRPNTEHTWNTNCTNNDTAATIHVRGLEMARSNTAGHISWVQLTGVCSILNQNPFRMSRVFRKTLKAHGHAILGNAQDAQSFRGEPLCMTVVELTVHWQDRAKEIITLESSPKFPKIMEKEERFWKAKEEAARANANDVVTTTHAQATDASVKAISSSAQQLPPQAYQTGRVTFAGLELFVDTRVMIPRRGSEAVVDRAVALYHCHRESNEKIMDNRRPRILDLGTGSGCLLLALMKKLGPVAAAVGVDRSLDALAVAWSNAQKTEFGGPCHFCCGTFAGSILDEHSCEEDILWENAFDIITCNPPYHTPGGRRPLDAATLAHEPHIALMVNGNDNNDDTSAPRTCDKLVHYRSVLQGLDSDGTARWRKQSGTVLVFEVFKENAAKVQALVESFGLKWVTTGTDATGCVRTVEGVYP